MKLVQLLLISTAIGVIATADARDRTRPAKVVQLTIAPGPEYTRVNARGPERSLVPSGNLIYSVEGVTLDLLVVYGINEGRALLRDPLMGKSDLPRFKASMSPEEIMVMYEALMEQAGMTAFKLETITPMQFGGAPGFGSQFVYERPSGLRIRGLSYFAVVDKILYLVVYSAPAAHYFEKHRALAETTVRSIQIGRSTSKKGQAREETDNDPD